MANRATPGQGLPGGQALLHGALAMALATALAAYAGPVRAFTPKLGDDAVKSIAELGTRQAADTGHGFQVQDYVLFDRENPLHIEEDTHQVDAVIVGTPREHLLYESYLEAFQGKELSFEKARAIANDSANTVRFRVFAHAGSVQPKDRDFLQDFGEATMTLDSGRTLRAEPEDISRPAQDFFILADGRHVFRWLGALNYRFDLGPLAKAGTDLSGLSGHLTFTDAEGHRYSRKFNLGNYR